MSATPTPAERVFDATVRPGVALALRELWTYRGTILAFAERDIRVKYKQAALGVAWALLQPLAFLGVFSIFFGRIARMTGDGVPYAAFALSALVPWTFIATSVAFGASALLSDASLVKKVYFPREVPVVAAILAATVDLASGLLAYFALAPFLGGNLSWTALLAPVLLVLLALPVLGFCLALAALNIYYRDFRYALPLAIQLWMFASPVAYPLTKVPESWRVLYAFANPVAGPLDGFRCALGLGTLPSPLFLAASAASGLLWLIVGYRIFKSMEPNFADVI